MLLTRGGRPLPQAVPWAGCGLCLGGWVTPLSFDQDPINASHGPLSSHNGSQESLHTARWAREGAGRGESSFHLVEQKQSQTKASIKTAISIC